MLSKWIFITKNLNHFWGGGGGRGGGARVCHFFTKNPNLKGGGGGGWWGGVDGQTDKQAQTNLPLQLLRSWGHNNA